MSMRCTVTSLLRSLMQRRCEGLSHTISSRSPQQGSQTLKNLRGIMSNNPPPYDAEIIDVVPGLWEATQKATSHERDLAHFTSQAVGTVLSITETLDTTTGANLTEAMLRDAVDFKRMLEAASITALQMTGQGKLASSGQVQSYARRVTESEERLKQSLSQSGATASIDMKIHNLADRVANKLQRRQEQLVTSKAAADTAELLQSLPSVTASWDRTQTCLSGTRTAIIDEILAWAKCSTVDSNIFWLHGVAGVGKTTIAHSVAESLHDNALVSSFFFRRNDADRSNPQLMLNSLAKDLALNNPKLGRHIMRALHAEGDLGCAALISQFTELIMKPVQSMIRSTPKDAIRSQVVIWDAIDECCNTRTWSTFLNLLIRSLPLLSPALRFIITSRALPEIQTTALETCMVYDSLDLSTQDCQNDLAVYIRHRLCHMGFWEQQKELCPCEDDVQRLVQCSVGLFIWASTALNWIGDSSNPKAHLTALLTPHCALPCQNPEVKLDELYRLAVATTCPQAFQLVAGSLIVLQRPLTVRALSQLIKYVNLDNVINKLSAVLGACLPSNEVRILHQSFADFLTNSHTLCTTPDLFINVHDHHTRLAEQCLLLMHEQLQRDLCNNTGTLTEGNLDPNLHLQQQVCDALKYACLFWASHVQGLPDLAGSSLFLQLQVFYNMDLLLWLEIMSCLQQTPSAISSLRDVNTLLNACKADKILVEASYDALRFAEHFIYILQHCTNHIYTSALAFTPQHTGLHKRFYPQFHQSVKVLQGVEGTWDHCYKILQESDYVATVAFSFDGRHIVSGSHDKTIHVWETWTGQPLFPPLEGHSVGVSSVAFSPDGHHIVSGSGDKTIRIWNAETGTPSCLQLEGHTKCVMCVAFSPDGSHIVSGSYDMTICVWDVSTGNLALPPIEGHTKGVSSVSFSPDGYHIISGSHDMSVRIWDAWTGQPVLPPLEAHTKAVTSVAMSPSGQHIVSASMDKTICMWDAMTGEPCVLRLEGHTDAVTSVAFSPDGRSIVSGSDDKTIRVWDAVTGDLLLPPLTGHTSWVTSVAFSPDGQSIVSGSWDRTLRVWNLEQQGNSVVPLERHDGLVFSIVFAPDGKHVVSGSADKTIRVWDAETGCPSLPPLEGHQDLVLSVACSLDSQYIASGSADDTVRIWDMHTGQPLGTPLVGHTARVVTVSFTSDGIHLISSSWDRTVRLWDYRTGELKQQLSSAQARITLPSFGKKESEEKDSDLLISNDFWICSESKGRVCWIPPVHRGKVAFSATGVALGSPSGRVTIIRLT